MDSSDRNYYKSSPVNNTLAPSQSTAYVSNIPFSLTSSDLHKIFESCGKVVKVSVVKDSKRRSKGIAFVLFLHPSDAQMCVEKFDKKEMFGRTWKCSIAIDNGRSTEFITKRKYPDKSKCYECKEEGHLSYNCPKNSLGDRPIPKKKKKSNNRSQWCDDRDEEISDQESCQDVGEDNLSCAIRQEQNLMEEENYRLKVANNDYSLPERTYRTKKIVKDGYFSDEEVIAEETAGID